MKISKGNLILLFFSLFLLPNCKIVNVSKADSLPTPTPESLQIKRNLANIDLTAIKHTVPQGRIQDDGLEGKNFNKLTIADDLISNGKDSIPFLINKLDDETKMDRTAMDYWYELHVGDMVLVILSDLFTKKDAETSTIPGFRWDEFLERGNDKDSTGEAILRKYIKNHGRKNIKERWQKMWDENKDKIYWDDTEKCFTIRQ
jgi:hypothetical protein